MNLLKIRHEEVLIGALLGMGAGLAVSAPLILLSHLPMPSLTDFVWPLALLREDPSRWTRLPHILVSVSGIACTLAGGWVAARQTSEQHVRGSRFLADPADAVVALQAVETPRMSPGQRAHRMPGFTIGGLEFSRSRETEHALVLGLPGGGKTAGVLRPLLDQALTRGDRVLLHDPKGDFCQSHYNPANTVLLGPWDVRSALWDGAGDMDSPALVDEFSASVCGVANAGQNRYFHEGAASILGGLIKSAMLEGKRWSWAQLGEALNREPIAVIRRAAMGDALVMKVIPSVFAANGPGDLSNGERGVLSTLANSSRMLMQLAAVDAARPDASRFSLRAWLSGEAHPGVQLVILNSSALYQNAVEAIFGAMLSVVSAAVVAAMPEKSADDDGLWCILDEGKQLGAIALERVQVIAEVGRSRGVRVVLGLQDAGQLEAAVGREKAGPMMSMQSTRFYLRAAPGAAETIVRTIGDREIQRITNTATAGAVQGKTSTYDRVPVLTTSDLTGLRTTRLPDSTVDIEALVAIEDTIGKLIQNSGQRRPSIAQASQPCAAWRAGLAPEQMPVQMQATQPDEDEGYAEDEVNPGTSSDEVDVDDFDWTKL